MNVSNLQGRDKHGTSPVPFFIYIRRTALVNMRQHVFRELVLFIMADHGSPDVGRRSRLETWLRGSTTRLIEAPSMFSADQDPILRIFSYILFVIILIP